MTRSNQKSPGRPPATDGEGQQARATLIETGARLFASQGFEGTSLRQLADGAEVTPAMVAYYFKDKAGLLEAVVRQGLSIMLEVVRSSVETRPEQGFVAHLVERYMATLTAEPWIPQIMIREVISRDSPLRELFVEEFAIHAASLVPARVAEEMQAGLLRADLDPRFAILSLLGMCMFPFIAHPVLGPLLNFELDESFGANYGDHVYRLFLHGAAPQGSGAQLSGASDADS